MENSRFVKIAGISVLFAVFALAPLAKGYTAIGDWGHFLGYTPHIYINNPEGKAFEVTLHVMKWPIDWNSPTTKAEVIDPNGEVIVKGKHKLKNAECTLEIPAGPEGVYEVRTHTNIWVSSTLDESVVWTGEPHKHIVEGDRTIFGCTVPRRWWFWVPRGTTSFTCYAMRAGRYMSQREDWGFFIITPRGQRIKALWGQPPITKKYQQQQKVKVLVEPGAAGRFWSFRAAYGDSHNYSNVNISFEGVPPYLARSPEEWFNPKTGEQPKPKIYDETPFIQSAPKSAPKKNAMKKRWPNLDHFSPCPSLGDPDGALVWGDGKFALWNPEGRKLKFRVGTYLPRADAENEAQLTVTGPDGKTVIDKKVSISHIHGEHGAPRRTLDLDEGVSTVQVAGTERWFSYTYPATPLVLIGEEQGTWAEFRLTTATTRNWYFYVPEGTKKFRVRAKAKHETDVMHMQVCAPDRTLGLIYGRQGNTVVKVPPHLDGKVWHLRPAVSSASRMITRKKPYRYQTMPLTIGMKGVPGYLAPTPGQWFHPGHPEKRPITH